MPTLAGKYGPDSFNYADGRPAANALVTVKNLNGTFATIYTNKTKQFTVTNPFSADQYGNIGFYVNPGEYILNIAGYEMNVVVDTHPNEPPSTEGQISSFRFDQTVPQSVFTVDHNLGRYPVAVSLFSLDLSVNYSEYIVQHLDINSLRITMDLPTAVSVLLV